MECRFCKEHSRCQNNYTVFYKSGKNPEPSSKDSVSMTDKSQSELLSRLSALKQRDQPVVFSTFGNFAESFCPEAPAHTIPKLPKSLRDHYAPHHLKDSDFSKVYQEEMSKEDNDFIERSTREQGNSMLWYSLRVGRITASIAHNVLHTNMENPSASLLLKMCTPGKRINTPAISWGRDNEGKAVQALLMELAKVHKNVSICKTGLRLHPKYNFIGASADGVGKCDCHGKFLVEIKRPFKHRERLNIYDCLKDSTFCIADDLHLKEAHPYMAQVQLQMNVHEIKQVIFTIWTPQFCFYSTVQYDETFDSCIDKLAMFHTRHVAKELVTRKLEMDFAKRTSAFQKDERELEDDRMKELFCACQQHELPGDEMIGCDNPLCKYKWFHLVVLDSKEPQRAHGIARVARMTRRSQ